MRTSSLRQQHRFGDQHGDKPSRRDNPRGVWPTERDSSGHDSAPACLREQLAVQHGVGDRPEHQHGHRYHHGVDPPGVYENPEWGSFEYQDRVDEVVASENRLYVNATDGTLRVYDTTNDAKTLIRTVAPGVFSDLELSADGKRLYGTSAGRLLVYDTATMTPVNVVVGPGAGEESDFGRRLEYTNGVGNVALRSDGKRAYVTYGSRFSRAVSEVSPTAASSPTHQGRPGW